MTDAILNREALVVPVGDNDPTARLNRQALIAGHTLPASAISAHLNRLSVIVVMSRPHGWGIFDDPPL
jgi:hypothetical protein